MALGVVVQLGPAERERVCEVGERRHAEALAQGRREAFGRTDRGDGLSLHVEGAAGELAACRVLGIPWRGDVNTFHAPDIGKRTQVRTRSRDHYDLIVRPGDADDEVFMLVVGRMPTYRVVGWIMGRDAKRSRWLRRYGGREAAYFVPQWALTPPSRRRASDQGA